MKYFNKILILFFLSTMSLLAAKAEFLKENDDNFKKLNIAIETKENGKDKITFIIKVGNLTLHGNKLEKVYLLRQNKNVSVTPEIKDSKAVITFDIERKFLKNSKLNLSYSSANPLGCPVIYILKLEDFLNTLDSIDEKIKFLCNTSVLKLGYIGRNRLYPYELTILWQISKDPKAEALFLELSEDKNTCAALYGLIGLKILKSKKFDDVKARLSKSKDMVKLHHGCYLKSYKTSYFTEQISKNSTPHPAK